MKIKNPNYEAAPVKAVTDNRAAVDALVKAMPAKTEFITPSSIRDALPAKKGDLTDGVIEEIAKGLGLEIVRE